MQDPRENSVGTILCKKQSNKDAVIGSTARQNLLASSYIAIREERSLGLILYCDVKLQWVREVYSVQRCTTNETSGVARFGN